MSFRLSGDQYGAGFGFATKATFYDKLVHALGSAAALVVVWTLFYWSGQGIDFTILQALQSATVIVLVAGVGLEIWQGIKGGREQRRLEDVELTLIKALQLIEKGSELWEKTQRDIKEVRHTIARLDGFSVRDILANGVGVLAVWALYYTLFIRAVG